MIKLRSFEIVRVADEVRSVLLIHKAELVIQAGDDALAVAGGLSAATLLTRHFEAHRLEQLWRVAPKCLGLTALNRELFELLLHLLSSQADLLLNVNVGTVLYLGMSLAANAFSFLALL